MLFFIVLLILVKISTSGASNVGTVLFHRKLHSDCWTTDEVALLKARKIFEDIIPAEVSPEQVDTKYIKNILAYFRRAIKVAEKGNDSHNISLLKEAIADTIGGHLRRSILPAVRFAYYAGYIPLRHARNMHDFYDSITTILNTKGYGWKTPALVPEWSNLTVVKVVIGGALFEPCSSLIMERDKNNCIHFPKPRTDDFLEPNTLLLPFKERSLVGLWSPNSENIVVNYYTTAARCILDKATNSCRHSDFVNFNNEIWYWMKRDVAPRLTDEKLYAAYGGVLRVAAAVQSYGKGLSRRNLFDTKKDNKKWKMWKRFSEEQPHHSRFRFFRDTSDYTFDMLVVVIATLFMYSMLVTANAVCTRCKCSESLRGCCNNRLYGRKSNRSQEHYVSSQRLVEKPFSALCRGCLNPVSKCSCKKYRWGNKFRSKYDKHLIAYSAVESNFPAMLPAPASPTSGSNAGKTSQDSRTGSIKTRVYDLNEEKEEEMEVVLKESPLSESEESDSFEDYSPDTTLVIEDESSPPQLETPISQLRVPRRSSTTGTSMLTSSNTRSWVVDDASWSDSGSSTSARSSTPRWRSSAEIAWSRNHPGKRN